MPNGPGSCAPSAPSWPAESGIGREGVHEGLPHFLETKFVVLQGRPAGYENTEL